jgi:hypothetical protein
VAAEVVVLLGMQFDNLFVFSEWYHTNIRLACRRRHKGCWIWLLSPASAASPTKVSTWAPTRQDRAWLCSLLTPFSCECAPSLSSLPAIDCPDPFSCSPPPSPPPPSPPPPLMSFKPRSPPSPSAPPATGQSSTNGTLVFGEWGDCSVPCGEGFQLRSVTCVAAGGAVLPLDACPGSANATTSRPCQ